MSFISGYKPRKSRITPIVHFSPDVEIIPETGMPPTPKLQPMQFPHAEIEPIEPLTGRYSSNAGIDRVAWILAILCTVPTLFLLGVVGWANNNPRTLCYEAPGLAMYYNRLLPALLTTLPGLIIGAICLMLPRYKKTTIEYFRREWSRQRVGLIMLLVTLITMLVMPWTWDLKVEGTQLDCAAFSI